MIRNVSILTLILILFIPSFTFAQSEQTIKAKSTPLSAPQDVVQNDSASKSNTLLPLLGSVAIVAGTFVLILWFLKKTQGDAGRPIPDSVLKVLGKTRIGTTPVFMVSVGKKLLFVSASTNGLTPLTEITDSVQIEEILKTIEIKGIPKPQ